MLFQITLDLTNFFAPHIPCTLHSINANFEDMEIGLVLEVSVSYLEFLRALLIQRKIKDLRVYNPED